ncbi:photosystem II reaction center PsbP family protein [Pseudonocardia sp. H11422]|uniref:photosystem II reaction center PsbP family protein n=1 Tax=Pseudonocardia sp. H11422 TaxID=2835866 RepID=UPI001BDD85E2|nr:photosystem II reaction center PsbP family protein [Pseudonocardia sp. H11422]
MRNARAGLALVMALAALLSGCSVAVEGAPAAAASGGAGLAATAFVDSRARFSLVPPRGWTPDASGRQDTAVVFLHSRPDPAPPGPFLPNINVVVLPAGADLAVTVVGARRELGDLTAYRPVEDETASLAGGLPAHVLGGTFTRAGYALRNLQLFTVSGGSTFVVTGTALADRWDDYRALFDASLHTLTVPA